MNPKVDNVMRRGKEDEERLRNSSENVETNCSQKIVVEPETRVLSVANASMFVRNVNMDGVFIKQGLHSRLKDWSNRK